MDLAAFLISKFQTIGVPILVLGVLIAVHEYGHFLLARLVGVPVEEYAIGFGKNLFSFRRGGTLYKLNLIPLGGYCRILGMNPEEEDFNSPEGYNCQPGWKRFLIVLGGPAFNLVSGILIAVSLFTYYGQSRGVVALHPMKGGPAAEAGIRAEDLILAINGKTVESSESLIHRIQTSEGKLLRVKVFRPKTGKIMEIEVQPKKNGGTYQIQARLEPAFDLVNRRIHSVGNRALVMAGLEPGSRVLAISGQRFYSDLHFTAFMATQGRRLKEKPVAIALRTPSGLGRKVVAPLYEKKGDSYVRTFLTTVRYEPMPLGESLEYSLRLPIFLAGMQISAFVNLFQGQTEGIGGPVAILGQVAESAKAGVYQVLWISVLLSFAIAFFNLFPFPGLDGGRILVVLLESLVQLVKKAGSLVVGGSGVTIKPWRLNPTWEARFHTVGILSLLVLIALITVRDLQRLFGS